MSLIPLTTDITLVFHACQFCNQNETFSYKLRAREVFHGPKPVAITSYGRVSGYFVSAHEYAELQRLRDFERRVYRIKELPLEIVEAIKASKMKPARDHLDVLLDEK